MMTQKVPYINIHTHRKVDGELSITTLGLHPYDAESSTNLRLIDITPQVEAIGEIGLDFACATPRAIQEKIFKEQLQLAEQLSLPVVIHSVRALDRTFEILAAYTLKAVIFHGFIGSVQQAKIALSKGYFLSFGHRCFASPKSLESLSVAPLSQIFFETDDFDISIEEIYTQAAQYRAESMDEIRAQLYKNYITIFNK